MAIIGEVNSNPEHTFGSAHQTHERSLLNALGIRNEATSAAMKTPKYVHDT